MLMKFLRRLKYGEWIDTRFLYDRWEQDHLRQLLSFVNVDCVFDVGANQGQYAQMLRKSVGFKGRIISFEPIPEAAANLRALAEADPLWQVEELALAAEDGMATFQVMVDSQFSSLSAPRHDDVAGFEAHNRVQKQIQVKTETLSNTLRRLHGQHLFQRPFLKLDTQGMDVSIVSAAGAATMHQFVGLQSELAVRKLYATSVDFRDALTCYESLGFELSAFVPNNAGHFPRLVELDGILVRRDLMPEKAM
jgi:FkbM family methyltransferase